MVTFVVPSVNDDTEEHMGWEKYGNFMSKIFDVGDRQTARQISVEGVLSVNAI